MQKKAIRPISLRHRMIVGVGAMLLPLVVLAGGSFFFFEQAVGQFEQNENQMFEELSPLANLEGTITKTADLFSKEDYSILEIRSRFFFLDQEANQAFYQLLNSPSMLKEKRSFVLKIQQNWLKAKKEATQIINDSTVKNYSLSENKTSQIKEYLDDAENQIHSLNYLFVQFQATDNLMQIKEFKQRVRLIVAIVFSVALIMVVGSALTLARSILQPLSILQKGVGYFGEGDLAHRIQLQTKDELEHLANAINDMAEKLEKSQKELTEMATIDGLTGVFNRREFNRRIKVELDRSRREGHPVSLLMVDIDHFKKVNDTYGHQSGDDVLRYVSSLLKREVRPGDQPARYGGEEFAVILPYANNNDVLAVAERIRTLLAAQDIPIQDNQTIRVTASLGGATFPDDAQSEETLMAGADEALYRAKHGGRNRVCLVSQMSFASSTLVTPTVETTLSRELPLLPVSQKS